MRLLRNIAASLLLLGGLWACDDEFKPDLPKGRVEEVSFARDTFIFGEGDGEVTVPIVAAKYLNYSSTVEVGVNDGTATEGTNFIIREKQVKIALGDAQAELEMEIVDDTIINENRSFTLNLGSIEGGGVPGTQRQSCTVIIRNDDYIPQATIMFVNAKDSVREDADSLVVPFYLTMAAEGDVTVDFAQGSYPDQTARHGVNFAFRNGKDKVTLPQGTLKGEVVLDIVNDEYPDGDIFFDLAVRDVQGALIGKDSLCRITILEDDLDRTVRFEGPKDGCHEEAGEVEVSLIFEGGVSEERMISGSIRLDSLVNCTAEDLELLTTSFSTAGDDTVKVSLKLKDNEEFGDWSAKLMLGGLKNVRAIDKDFLVSVKDDERKLGFADTVAVEVEEGSNVTIKLKLDGGNADVDIPWKVEVVEDSTTALPEQYDLPTSFLKMYKGLATAEFTLKTNQHESRNDRILKLKVSATDGVGESSPHKIHYENDVITVVIKNTDGSIGLGTERTLGALIGRPVKVPVVVAGVDGDAVVYISPKEGTADGAALSINGSDYSGQPIAVPIAGGKSKDIDVVLKSITHQNIPVELEISQVAGEGVSDSDIDPETSSVGLSVLKGLQDAWNGTYDWMFYYQDEKNITFPAYNPTQGANPNDGKVIDVSVDMDGDSIVLTINKFIQVERVWDGDVKMDFNGSDGTFSLRLGVHVGDAQDRKWAYYSRIGGNDVGFSLELPVIINPDYGNGWLLWNTNGELNDNNKLTVTGDQNWRLGICSYDAEEPPATLGNGAANSRYRAFKLMKK